MFCFEIYNFDFSPSIWKWRSETLLLISLQNIIFFLYIKISFLLKNKERRDTHSSSDRRTRTTHACTNIHESTCIQESISLLPYYYKFYQKKANVIYKTGFEKKYTGISQRMRYSTIPDLLKVWFLMQDDVR